MHKKPLTTLEEAGLIAHGLGPDIGRPSMPADLFRIGLAWGRMATPEIIEGISKQITCGIPLDEKLRDRFQQLLEVLKNEGLNLQPVSIKTAEERIHPLAIDDKSVWCNAYFDEVQELRAALEALQAENAAQAKRIAEFETPSNPYNKVDFQGKLYITGLQNQIEALRKQLETAVNRINDMLQDDDGQAHKEARKFIESLSSEGSPAVPSTPRYKISKCIIGGYRVIEIKSLHTVCHINDKWASDNKNKTTAERICLALNNLEKIK